MQPTPQIEFVPNLNTELPLTVRVLAALSWPDAYLSTKELAKMFGVERLRMSSCLSAIQNGHKYPRIESELIGLEKHFWMGSYPTKKPAFDGRNT